MSSVWIAAFLVGGTLLAWRPQPPRPDRRCRAADPHGAGWLCRGGDDAAAQHRPKPGAGFGGLVGLLSGLSAAFAYMQVVALSGWESPKHAPFSILPWARPCRWRGPAGDRHLTLAGMARTVAAAHRGAGRRRAAVHDARLRQCAHPARHARGGQPAVFRDRLRVHFRCAAV